MPKCSSDYFSTAGLDFAGYIYFVLPKFPGRPEHSMWYRNVPGNRSSFRDPNLFLNFPSK